MRQQVETHTTVIFCLSRPTSLHLSLKCLFHFCRRLEHPWASLLVAQSWRRPLHAPPLRQQPLPRRCPRVSALFPWISGLPAVTYDALNAACSVLVCCPQISRSRSPSGLASGSLAWAKTSKALSAQSHNITLFCCVCPARGTSDRTWRSTVTASGVVSVFITTPGVQNRLDDRA